MKARLLVPFVLIILDVLSIQLVAENEKAADIAPFDKFASLVGHWRGDGLGGVCEETWLPESGGIMLGTFKLMKDDKVSFFEIMSLSIDSLGPAIRVKHFNADMTGWEDKAEMVTFRYDSTSNGQLFFGSLRFKRPAEDLLNISVRFKKSDGSTNEQFINCQRIELK